ncbi:MAG: hypothetical protein AAGD43_17200 [Pseudomonadota bacterium]
MTLRIFWRLSDARQRRKTRRIITNLPKSIQRDIGLIDGLSDGVLSRSR